MTNRKLFETTTVIAVAALALSLFAPAAFAQARHFNLQIPFDFYAGSRLMPAGSYTVEYDAVTKAARIYDREGHATTALAQATTNHLIGKNRIVFNRYGSLSFLSQMQWAASDTGWAFRESQLELDAKLGASPVKVAVQPQK